VVTSRKATDWDQYYTSVPATAKVTRRYSTAVLVDAIRRYAAPRNQQDGLAIVEIGGANSCFLGAILAGVHCRSYEIIDTNPYGLSLVEQRFGHNPIVRPRRESVLALSPDARADLVFSVGLVEHFDPENTRKAVLAHFDLLRPGGTVIITFPTPTLLYRITRKAIELAGMWKFHDERPLEPCEVAAAIRERGDIAYEKMMWPLMLTQYVMVARKRLE